ncbi:UNVERIFIED_CONTAM: G-type lectin S-receptor-like serine/threonine-protein kinase [Sesamum angustifolium]|uniref:G-type lectin S-receptor-like serine/threonine-protein kinase n=1 Tax=Sesamum angustifolium TaxID=2727405 RepID=A0AAW2PFY9_9LAMI
MVLLEYAADGLFSVKSDVYSFVVLVLAIVSGLKNRGFHHKDQHHNFPGHAWLLHEERRSLELVDTINLVYLFVSEAMRLIRVAVLCGQHSPDDRPSMSSVVLMLSREGALPQPKQPGFFAETNVLVAATAETTTSSHKNATSSPNSAKKVN